MTASLDGWRAKGFSQLPVRRLAPSNGLQLFRCWGETKGGDGSRRDGHYFSLKRPGSVLEAELHANIAQYGNRIFSVSTFELKGGATYWQGPIWHNSHDMRVDGLQVYVEELSNVRLLNTETLKQNVPTAPGSKINN